MARPASRKAVSSLPAIANTDEQLDEVVMTDSQHIISILFHIIQAIIALAFLFFMWRWSRKPKMTSEEEHQAIKQQNELAAELERQLILHKKQLQALKDMTSIGH